MKIQLNRENEYCVINDSANDKSSCTQIATLRGGVGIKYMKLLDEFIR